jgi:hypothetical protein
MFSESLLEESGCVIQIEFLLSPACFSADGTPIRRIEIFGRDQEICITVVTPYVDCCGASRRS